MACMIGDLIAFQKCSSGQCLRGEGVGEALNEWFGVLCYENACVLSITEGVHHDVEWSSKEHT